MLTSEHLNILRKPFRADEHEFLKERAYITEGAITNRIEDVDPAWSMQLVNLYQRDSQIIATVRLTVCGVSRENTGMSAIAQAKSGGEANEAEKSAVTDALKRAARLFGIGRYLLDLPPHVKDVASMRQYLGESNPYNAKPAAPANDDAWTQASAGKFAAMCKGKGIDPLKALNVSKWDEWKGTYSEAVAKIAA